MTPEHLTEIYSNNEVVDSPLSDHIVYRRPDPVSLKYRKQIDSLKTIWADNGYIPGASNRLTLTDMFKKDEVFKQRILTDGFSTDQPLLMPRVLSEISKGPAEPVPSLYNSNVYQRLGNYDMGQIVTFLSWGAMHAADIQEGGEYPERSLEVAGENSIVVGKSGIALKFSYEMIQFSMFNVMSRHLEAAHAAMARHKEEKMAASITNDGTVIFDNSDTAVLSTTGRGPGGQTNGSLTLDDLFHALSILVDNGFRPNTLICHPAAWQIWTSEGLSRAFAFHNNGAIWNPYQGSPGNPWAGVGSLTRNAPDNPTTVANTLTSVPGIFPWPIRVVASAYMPYSSSNGYTDLAFLDDREAGVVSVGEDVNVATWEEPARDITKLRLREFYGISSVNGGAAIALIKNVRLVKSWDLADRVQMHLTTGDITQSLTGDFERKDNPTHGY